MAAGARDDSHRAGWWRAGVGDGASCGQHGHVERQRHVLLARLVYTFDVERFSVRSNQFGMFLHYKDEACQTL